MRHNVFGRKLGRDTNERKALMRNLVSSLIFFGKIRTTLEKAKAVKGEVDKLITLAKKSSVSSERRIKAILNNKDVMKKLMGEIVPKLTERKSGYTRIRRVGRRLGDNSEEVFFEFIFDKKIQKKNKSETEKEKIKSEVKKKKKK